MMQTIDPNSLVEGIFIHELKNRFLCEVSINEIPTTCYVPSSCHLSNFLQLQGKRVLLIKNNSSTSRTMYALFAVPYKKNYILLKPAYANQVVKSCINSQRFSFLGNRRMLLQEHTINGYKTDLYIEDTSTIIEIKAVIASGSEAIFPTVYSERTIKQLSFLSEWLTSGKPAALFVVSLNPYVKSVRINTSTDFWKTLKQCLEKGLSLRAFSCRFCAKDGSLAIDKELPIDL